jgi:hypothetical protein
VKTLRSALTIFLTSAFMIIAPIAVAAACEPYIIVSSEPGGQNGHAPTQQVCYLVGEDDDYCYYSC